MPLNETETFISICHGKLKAESIAKAIEIFIGNYQSDKSDKNLQTLSRLFNSLLPESHKKKQQVNTRQSLVLLKVNFDGIDLGESQ